MRKIKTTFMGWTIGEIKAAAPSELQTRLQELEAARIALQHEREYIEDVLKKNGEGPAQIPPGDNTPIVGKVTDVRSGDYWRIDGDDSRIVWLETWALRSAKAGDRVRVEYRQTKPGTWGWVVAHVHYS